MYVLKVRVGGTALMVVSGGVVATVKVAETLVAPFIVKLQLPLPLQAPDQPEKMLPVFGTAVRVTGVPLLYGWL